MQIRKTIKNNGTNILVKIERPISLNDSISTIIELPLKATEQDINEAGNAWLSLHEKEYNWLVYILKCADNSLYTGITNNLEKRLKAHNMGIGAKYTKSRRPCKIVACTDAIMKKSEAMKIEWQIKQLPRNKKIDYLKNFSL